MIAIEIKAGKTISGDYFLNLDYWNKLSSNSILNSYLIYGGEQNQKRSNGNVVSWRNIGEVV
jgi:hypothetical protein